MLSSTFRAFRHRDYSIFWFGLLLGHTGTLIQTTAQSWLLFQLTNSAFYRGLEGFCLGWPRVLFSAFGARFRSVDSAVRRITQLFILAALVVLRRRVSSYVFVVYRYAAASSCRRNQSWQKHVALWSDQSRLGPDGEFPLRPDRQWHRRFGNRSCVRSTDDCFGWVCRVLPASAPSGSVRRTHRYQPPTVRNIDQPLKKLGDLAR